LIEINYAYPAAAVLVQWLGSREEIGWPAA